MNVDVENIANKNNKIGDQNMKLLIIIVLQQQLFSNRMFRPM